MAQGGTGTEYFIQVAKTGIRYGWSFEARINDDLDQLMDVVRDFPNMAANTEDRKALGQIINLATGAPATTFFNAGNNNLGQMKLTRESLLRVQRFLRTKRDAYLGGIIPRARSSSSSARRSKASRTRSSASCRVDPDGRDQGRHRQPAGRRLRGRRQ